MSKDSSTKARLDNYTSQDTWNPPVIHLIPLRGPSSQGSCLQAHLIFAILTCYSCFLVREKRHGKEKYKTAMQKNQRRPEVKAGQEKQQHAKYLLCLSTREVISTTLLQTRTLEQGEGDWRCAAMVTQTLSAQAGRSGRSDWAVRVHSHITPYVLSW